MESAPTPVRLAFLCNSPAVPAGVEKTVLMLLDGLDRSRFEARVILNGSGPFEEALRDRGVDVEVLPARNRLERRCPPGLAASLRERPADVVQMHLSRLNAPVLHRSGATVVERLNMTRHSGLYPMRWPLLDRYTQRWVDRFIVVSRSLRNAFVERGYPRNKLELVYNGVQVGDLRAVPSLRSELGLPETVSLIGTACRLTRQKGVEDLIAAVPEICAAGRNVHVVVAGEGELRGSLEALARHLGVESQVHFLGFRADVLPVLAGLDVVVYLSRWEPFSNTVLEAMALGRPIVATDVGGNAEALADGETALLVPVGDRGAVVCGVRRLLADPELARLLANNAASAAADYSVARMVRGHEAVYDRLVQGR